MFKTTKAIFIKGFLVMMRESYPSLTEDGVKKELNILLAGGKPTNVIGMFMESELKEIEITDKDS